jgi:hypothetical protein
MQPKQVLGFVFVAILVLPVAWWLAGLGASPAEGEARAAFAAGTDPAEGPRIDPAAFTGGREETAEFIQWNGAITLTPEQEAVRVAALKVLPAPCCKEFTADKCCCPCNMAKATWGLAKHLIAIEGRSTEEVRSTVAAWHRAINPEGFEGDSCSTGKCGLAFRHDGCGGMDGKNLVF